LQDNKGLKGGDFERMGFKGIGSEKTSVIETITIGILIVGLSAKIYRRNTEHTTEGRDQ
jgi:hypothetical protein